MMYCTKNYQARRTYSPLVAASLSPAAATPTATAAPAVAAAPRNGKGETCESVVEIVGWCELLKCNMFRYLLQHAVGIPALT